MSNKTKPANVTAMKPGTNTSFGPQAHRLLYTRGEDALSETATRVAGSEMAPAPAPAPQPFMERLRRNGQVEVKRASSH